MGRLGDLPVLWRLLRGMPARGSHQDRLDAFYRDQAGDYDRFRERLLTGRADLLAQLDPAPGASIVELGAGTGRNLDFLGARLGTLGAVHLVDLCPSLLRLALDRVSARGWTNVHLHHADAVRWRPERPVDAVLCIYSLTMIPDWEGALANAEAMLAPGGRIAVADFTVSAAAPEPGLARHGAFARWFWPRWFGHDGVRPHPGHLPALRRRFETVSLTETMAPVPWLPGLRVPCYRFIGRRR